MLRIIEVILLVILAGLFDGIMDMIKDFKHSDKNWLWNWILNHTIYLDWYAGDHSLPFFEKRGYIYDPSWFWLSDAWHLAKHGMLLSFAGAIAIALNLSWYYQAFAWWFAYWFEGQLFNLVYRRLK